MLLGRKWLGQGCQSLYPGHVIETSGGRYLAGCVQCHLEPGSLPHGLSRCRTISIHLSALPNPHERSTLPHFSHQTMYFSKPSSTLVPLISFSGWPVASCHSHWVFQGVPPWNLYQALPEPGIHPYHPFLISLWTLFYVLVGLHCHRLVTKSDCQKMNLVGILTCVWRGRRQLFNFSPMGCSGL